MSTSLPTLQARPRDLRPPAAAGVLLAAAIGAGVAWNPAPMVVLGAAVMFVVIAMRRAEAVLAVGLVALTYSPEYLPAAVGVFARPELPKALLYVALVPLLVSRGVRPGLSLVIPCYVVLALLSVLHDDLIPGLTAAQMASSFVTLTLGWAALAVRWDWDRDHHLLKIVCVLPLICVVLGGLLQLRGLHPVFQAAGESDGTTRLQGASIAAQLAMSCFVAAVTSLVCWRQARWRAAPYLFALNTLILALTVSRGAALALAVAVSWPALRWALGREGAAHRVVVARSGLLICVVIALLVTLVPAFASRGGGGYYVPGQGVLAGDATSGRSNAYREFYAIATESPLYGHGLGSGPITSIEQDGFIAQHNEYLRLFLEGGLIGGGLVFAAMVLTLARCIARAPKRLRGDLTAFAIAFAVLSFTDNTLTSINLLLPIGLLFGICSARGPASSPASPS